MGSFYHSLAKLVRLGSAIALAAFFAVPGVFAQQTPRSDQLLASDGTLIPDFERSDRQQVEEPGGESAVQAPVRVNEPQDPLNESYANDASRSIDQRDIERFNSVLPDPLNQLPHNFRDTSFTQGLVRQQKNRQVDDNWRARDDTAFDPLGIRTGGFVFYPELYAHMIGTNNMFATSDNRKADSGVETSSTFRLRSDWNVHELEFFVTGKDKRWRTFTSENTIEYETRVRGRLDITSRTSVEAAIRHEQTAEGRGSVELSDAAVGPATAYETEFFGQLNHRFNRLGFRMRGQVIRYIYDDVALRNGGVQNNHFRDFDEKTLNLRTNYEFSPRFSLYADTQLGRRKFTNRLDAGGLLQGSDSWLMAVGTRIELTSNLSFLGNVGYARAKPDEPTLVDLEGVVFDASLIWSPFRYTTVTLTGQSELEETTQSGTPGSLNRSVSASLVKEWTHRFSSTLSAEFEERDFAGIAQKDTEFTVGLVAEYMFNRSWALDAGIEHTIVKGGSKYSEDEVLFGLKWRR
ncbi:MAG: outer membrane beta-barrel protein [bacterium]|nr:outer membrane beta-barrel protein [bacterium]